MSDRSDYIRCVSGPLEAKLRARIAGLEKRLRAAEGALALIYDVAEGMNPDQNFNAPSRLNRCAQIAEEALPPPPDTTTSSGGDHE